MPIWIHYTLQPQFIRILFEFLVDAYSFTTLILYIARGLAVIFIADYSNLQLNFPKLFFVSCLNFWRIVKGVKQGCTSTACYTGALAYDE